MCTAGNRIINDAPLHPKETYLTSQDINVAAGEKIKSEYVGEKIKNKGKNRSGLKMHLFREVRKSKIFFSRGRGHPFPWTLSPLQTRPKGKRYKKGGYGENHRMGEQG